MAGESVPVTVEVLARGRAMSPLACALDAFYLEHRRCRELESGVEEDRVWMTCTCGARMVRAVDA